MREDLERVVNGYLEADAAGRACNFDAFVTTLATLSSEEGAKEAATVARRAVTPQLDYTSLKRLAKFARGAGTTPVPLRLAVLGGPTTLQLVSLLELVLESMDIGATIYQCEYGLFRQEILAPGSQLDAFQPQVIFLAVDARDVSRAPSLTANAAERTERIDAETNAWLELVETAGRKWSATVLLNTFVTPTYPALGHLACRHQNTREAFLEQLNQRLFERGPANLVLHDVRLLAREFGHRHWFEPRFYHEAKMPCAPECLVRYAFSVGALLRALRGKSKKVLVLDLDNTLWGGVVGDVGVEGISLGQGSGEGEAFVAFQEYALALHERGVLLAVCSKNDEARAKEPFEKRGDMVVRLEHISCFVANLNDKAHNLRHIASTLSLGLDSLVFVDDNPVERALVRRLVPAVAVPDLPEDPAGFVEALTAHQYFESITFTAEDAERARYYKQDAQRASIVGASGDVDAFLKSLEMVGRAEPVGPVNIARVTQLLNKSNQFNLTTRRYTQAQIEVITADRRWATLAISLRDRFGDSGLISVILLQEDAGELVIDTWLMSCRVLQRGVEAFALQRIIDIAKPRGCSAVRGLFIPTAKNGMVKDHYERLGFAPDGRDGETSVWRLDLARPLPPPKTHVNEG